MCDREEKELKRRADAECNQAQTQAGIAQAGGAMMSGDYLLDHMFRHHPPTRDTVGKHETLREGARHFAKLIHANVPSGADRVEAIRKVREALMTANAGIACDGVSF